MAKSTRPRKSKAPALDAKTGLQAGLAATQSTGLDYFFGPYPGQLPEVIAHHQLRAEAQRAITVAQQWPVRARSSKDDAWKEIGRLANEVISNAPNLTGPHKDQYWDGCRQCAILPRDAVVNMIGRFAYYKYAYELQTDMSQKWAAEAQRRYQDHITRGDELGYMGNAAGNAAFYGVVTLLFGAAAVAGGAILAGSRGRDDLPLTLTKALPYAAGLVGLLGAYAAGSATQKPLWLLNQAADGVELKQYNEKPPHLLKERVHMATMNKIYDILKTADTALHADISDDERDEIKRKTQRAIDDQIRWSRGNKAPAWAQLEKSYLLAWQKNDISSFIDVILQVCDQGNRVRSAFEQGTVQRVGALLGGFARGAISPLSGLPTSTWL